MRVPVLVRPFLTARDSSRHSQHAHLHSLYLPALLFNRETHIIGVAIYFVVLTWLSTFKILLLCWSTGPGSEPYISTYFPRFAIAMTHPLHMKRAGKVVKRVPVQYPSLIDYITKSENWQVLILRSALKAIVLITLLQIMLQRELLSLPLIVFHALCTIQLYLFVTIVLEIIAAVANTAFSISIEPHFDNPFAAVKLEEFWARRWNLLVSNCLRETIFNPVYRLLQSRVNPKTRVSSGFDGPKLVAMMAAFLVSGLAHELSVWYTTRAPPTGRMNSFFVVQGLAVAAEAAWKVYLTWRPPRLVSRISTLAFVFLTAHWLFWPPLDPEVDQTLLEVQRMLPWYNASKLQ